MALVGCSGDAPTDAPADAPKGDAPAVAYSALASKIGSRVKVTAWVLGEGGGFTLEARYLNVLTPDPKVDWGAMVDDWKAAKALLDQLQDKPDAPADAGLVGEYTRIADAAEAWSGLIAAQESKPESIAWGDFGRNVVDSEYAVIGETPTILVSPKRSELKAAADAIVGRLDRMTGSVEVEVTGTVVKSADWSSKRRLASADKSSVESKAVVVEIDSIKILRVARDSLGGPTTRGAEGVAQPQTK
jgi:hypothetical protein